MGSCRKALKTKNRKFSTEEFSELDNSNKSLKINVKNGMSDTATTNKFLFLLSTTSYWNVDSPNKVSKFDNVSIAVIESLVKAVSA